MIKNSKGSKEGTDMMIGMVNDGAANGQSFQIRKDAGNDSFSKGINNQIAGVQKQLQSMSEDKEMSIEDRMKKRQELQKQISELQNQLRQHEIEKRREESEKKKAEKEALSGGTHREKENTAGLSEASMKGMLSADSAMKEARVQGAVKKDLKGKAGVLRSEIERDKSGRGVEKKKEELAETLDRVDTVSASQMNSLSKAQEEIRIAGEKDQTGKEASEKKAGINSDLDSADKRDELSAGSMEARGRAEQTNATLSSEAAKGNYLDEKL